MRIWRCITTISLDNALILLGEIRCWSLVTWIAWPLSLWYFHGDVRKTEPATFLWEVARQQDILMTSNWCKNLQVPTNTCKYTPANTRTNTLATTRWDSRENTREESLLKRLDEKGASASTELTIYEMNKFLTTVHGNSVFSHNRDLLQFFLITRCYYIIYTILSLSLYWNRFCCVHSLSSSQLCSSSVTWHIDNLVMESVE